MKLVSLVPVDKKEYPRLEFSRLWTTLSLAVFGIIIAAHMVFTQDQVVKCVAIAVAAIAWAFFSPTAHRADKRRYLRRFKQVLVQNHPSIQLRVVDALIWEWRKDPDPRVCLTEVQILELLAHTLEHQDTPSMLGASLYLNYIRLAQAHDELL